MMLPRTFDASPIGEMRFSVRKVCNQPATREAKIKRLYTTNYRQAWGPLAALPDTINARPVQMLLGDEAQKSTRNQP